ncbi:MAG: ABC-three component system middle component 1 [Lachnospirales bacterium]
MDIMINKVFECCKYKELEELDVENIKFFKNEDTLIANYFIIYFIDCREIEDDEKSIQIAMNKLEYIYTNSENSEQPLKEKIKNLFNSTQEASQLDKNTSAIYLMLFNDLSKIDNYRNLVYSIEESPNYFKRYVLPYTQEQIDNLNKTLNQYPEKSIIEALNEAIDNKEHYFRLLKENTLNNQYGLLIRMFSKLPFLQYNFKTELAPEPIIQIIKNNLPSELNVFQNIIFENKLSINEIYNIMEENKLTDDELEKEFQNKLKE